MRRLRRLLLTLLGAELLVVLMAGFLADRLILFPSTGPVPAVGATRHLAPYAGGQLEFFVARSPGCVGEPAALVLDLLGNAERAEYAAPADAALWGDLPVEVWALNHPGFGQSTGPAALSRLGPAALAAWDEVDERAAGRPVFVQGTSLGTTMALLVAAQRPVAGVVLRTPCPLRSLILRRHGWWNLWLLAGPIAWRVPPEIEAMRTAPQARASAVFVIIDHDTIIPAAYQEQVFAAYGGPRQVVHVRRGDHNDPLDAEALGELRQALGTLLPGR
jgi:hypothetical protein